MLPNMFRSFEEDLNRRIQQGEAPFLGLFIDSFGEHVRNFLQKTLHRKSSPIEACVEGLDQFPAIFACYLIFHITENFGDLGHFAVYRYIEQAIGSDLTNSTQRRLWSSFRRACIRLGLSISPRTAGTHYIVDEFLQQAGFPHQYLPELTRRMMRLAEVVGLPDDDDPESISLWQEDLVERLKSPFSRVAREAMERDDKGYYVRLFIKLLNYPAQEGSVIEQVMKDTIERSDKLERSVQKLSIPQILFRDLQLGVLLPGGPQNSWEMDVDGDISRYRHLEGDRFVPFPSNLPKKVEIKGAGSSVQRIIWEDERNNRLLIFYQPSGRFLQGATLGQDAVELQPGQYSLLLRFQPEETTEEIECLCDDPSLYLVNMTLMPGEAKRLGRGPAELLLQAFNVPTLNWVGDSIRSLRGTDLYASKGLRLEVILPQEYLDESEVEYILTLKPGSLGEDKEILLERFSNGKGLIDIETIGEEWKPGVTRLLAELRRQDSRRILARTSILMWNGLLDLKKSVFHCRRLPENLQRELCDNVDVKISDSRVTYRDDTHRFFRLVFEDGGRHHSFTWPVPGIFLSIEEHGQGGSERTVRIGSTLAINASTRSVLKVSATEPAFLELGELRVKADFSRIGIKRLPLAGLLEYIGPESSTLMLRYEGSLTPIPLVRLASPHEATGFRTNCRIESCEICFSVQGAVEAFSISAEDLISGAISTIEFQGQDIEMGVSRDFSLGGRATVFCQGNNEFTIYISLNNWRPGLWALDFQARVEGKWGALADRKGDVYSSAILLHETGRTGVFSDVYTAIENLDMGELEKILARVHKRLLIRHAQESSPLVNHLIETWNGLFKRLKVESSVQFFLSLLVERPSQLILSSWIPKNSLSAVLPQIFCHPGGSYGGIRKHKDSVFLDCLRFFPKLRNPVSLLSSRLLDPAVAGGFANFIEIVTGASPPRDFDLTKYRQTLAACDVPERWSSLNDDDWRPGDGDYLGPMHYRYAICRMRDLYHETIAENQFRRGMALSLLNRVSAFNISRYAAASSTLSTNGAIDLGLFETECRMVPEQDSIENEYMSRMVRFFSLFAQVCRLEPRCPGTLGRFLTDLKGRIDVADQKERQKCLRSILSYLHYVGEDMFAFYLLLWELVYTCDLDMRGKQNV